VIYYIHRNPLHHKLTNDPSKYIYSSYNAIINNYDSFVNKNQTVEWFGDINNFTDYHNCNFQIDKNIQLDDTLSGYRTP